MYNEIHDEIFNAMLKTALDEYVEETEKALPSDKEIAEMYPMSDKNRRKFDRIAKEKKYKAPLGFVYFKRVASVFLIAIALMSALLIANPTVRAGIHKAILEWRDNNLWISFDSEPYTNLGDFRVGYVPAGFRLDFRSDTGEAIIYMYVSENGDDFSVRIFKTKGNDGVYINADNAAFESFMIGENEAYLIYKDDTRSGKLVTGNSDYTISISAKIDRDELIKIAESVKPFTEEDKEALASSYDPKYDALRSYMSYFVGWFHETYKEGDDISDMKLKSLNFLFTVSNRDALDFVDVTEKSSEMFIEGEGFRKIAKNLFGDDIDISAYNNSGWVNTYDEEKDIYYICYGTDYWDEDFYAVDDETPMEITENGNTVTVTANVYHYPDLGTWENMRMLKYTFKAIEDFGMTFYRIVEIEVLE